jgi:crotonobetainyl-CoA hydratase
MTEKPEIVRTERRGAVLEVTLDRAPVNAINNEVSRALYRAFSVLRDDPDLRVGILTGAGRIFSAGWDLKEVAQAESGLEVNHEAMSQPGGFGGITEFWDLHKPVIAAVNGIAIGGGFELALGCDIIVMSDGAWFQLPEMLRGFVSDAGAVQRLPRRLPYNVAVEMMLTGRRMNAEEAVHWGLVHAALPLAQLMDKARELAAEIVEGAPLAVEALLEVIPAIFNLTEEQAFARTKPGRSELERYERMIHSEDFLEGPRAFAEKRKPVWKGR